MICGRYNSIVNGLFLFMVNQKSRRISHIVKYIQIKLLKKSRVGTWFYSSIVDWMEADLNTRLRSI